MRNLIILVEQKLLCAYMSPPCTILAQVHTCLPYSIIVFGHFAYADSLLVVESVEKGYIYFLCTLVIMRRFWLPRGPASVHQLSKEGRKTGSRGEIAPDFLLLQLFVLTIPVANFSLSFFQLTYCKCVSHLPCKCKFSFPRLFF